MSARSIRIPQTAATLDDESRATLAALADVIIPAAADFPSGSEAGVAGKLVDAALQARPDRMKELIKILAYASGRPPMHVVATLCTEHPVRFAILVEAVTGAYFLNPAVLEAFGYRGQRPVPIVANETDYEDLLPDVLARGLIYRATPQQSRLSGDRYE
jgi:hypothetical protein